MEMSCDGCKKEIPLNIPVGAFCLEKDSHSITYQLCEQCAKLTEHYILYRLD